MATSPAETAMGSAPPCANPFVVPAVVDSPTAAPRGMTSSILGHSAILNRQPMSVTIVADPPAAVAPAATDSPKDPQASSANGRLTTTVEGEDKRRPSWQQPQPPAGDGEGRKWSVTHASRNAVIASQPLPAPPLASPVHHHGAAGGLAPPVSSVQSDRASTNEEANSFRSDQHTVPSSRPVESFGTPSSEDDGRKASDVRTGPLVKSLGAVSRSSESQENATIARSRRRMEAWVASVTYGPDACQYPASVDLSDALYNGPLPRDAEVADEELERFIEEMRFRILMGLNTAASAPSETPSQSTAASISNAPAMSTTVP